VTWQDIQGWFDFQHVYDEAVRRAKPNARLVEIGAWLGKSTAYLAQAIKDSGKSIELHVVDSWDNCTVSKHNGPSNGGAYANSSTKALFYENMKACAVEATRVIERDSTAAADCFLDESIDFLFLDGDHSPEKVYADLKAWWPKIKPGGLLAGHDFDEPGPNASAIRFAEEIGKACYGDGGFGRALRCFSIPKPSNEEYGIFLALPHYNGTACAASMVTACLRSYSGKGFVAVKENGCSALCSNFNHLWCQALNMPNVTHFAMVHADILPMEYWLDVLVREMEQEQAQLVSTIVPIKDNLGITSTGIVLPGNHWTPKRRFTMQEIIGMPSTFDAELAGYSNERLVLNTGCWLADLRDARWKTELPDGSLVAHFEMRDMIRKVEGEYRNFFEPEDFFFSRTVQELGMKAVATRKPNVTHIGNFGYTNDAPWGQHRQDERTRPLWETEETIRNAETETNSALTAVSGPR